jgi:hypothetical protein
VTRARARTVLALAGVALCGGLLAACGDAETTSSSPAAAAALDETFAATSKLRSARIDGRMRLEPDGLLALGGPIVLHATGPVAAPAGGKGPRFDLAFDAALGAQTFKGGASATGSRAYLRLGDRSYALRGHGRRFSRLHAKRGALGALGLDPARWVKDPKTTSSRATIDGVETTTVTGDLDVARVLADVAKLFGDGGGLLTPKLRAQLAGAVKSATVQVAAGADDKILRRLTAAIDFTFPKGEQPPITGLDGGKIDLHLNLTGVNATRFDVATPANARPLSELLGDRGIESLLKGLGASFGAGAGRGDGGAGLLRCIEAADGQSAAVARCAAKLSP